ncbi:MAG: PAS domain S-box protein [Rhodocyclaceae bacterium]|nr:PAS domain S-box protein [Rhodocyclaceae bacterium]MBK6907175.1 PAS domain S-box protein [Rhodocyclaceae bacterium]
MLTLTDVSERKHMRLLWWLPRFAFGAFIAVVLALLWYSDRSTREEQRGTLLSDVLWLEQNIKFQMEHNEELLARLDPTRWQNTARFEAEVQTLLANNSGLRRVVWLDDQQRPARAAPQPPGQEDEQATGTYQEATVARSLGRAVYGPPRLVADEWEFSVYLPLFHDGAYHGTSVGIYSLRRLLEASAPWWLTERYRIVVLDADANVLAERSRVAEVESERAYQTPFDPPGHGLLLSATPYYTPTPLAGRMLSFALLALAILVLASLWALRRHVQGRLAAESGQRAEVAFRKAMEDSLQTGLRARDLNGRMTYVNPAFCRMVGWSADELVGRVPPMPYWAEEHIEETRAMHQRVLAGDSPSDGFEIRFRRRDGQFFDALIHEAPLIDGTGKQTGWMGSVVDVTERKRAAEATHQHEQRLQASARLITMGEMASSLAHELNQPLAAISSYITGCRNLIGAGTASLADLDGALAKCQDQAQRAARIIRRIYEFVRRHEPKAEDCDLPELIADLVSLLEADARRQGVRIVCDVQQQPVPLQGDRVLLGQALLNLMKNGIEAMRDTPREQRKLLVSFSVSDQSGEIRIRDAGTGVSGEAAAHLFEPFFTTKTEGLGVGLNICRSVIEAHHGRLWHEANPEGGSTFCITLPLNHGTASP